MYFNTLEITHYNVRDYWDVDMRVSLQICSKINFSCIQLNRTINFSRRYKGRYASRVYFVFIIYVGTYIIKKNGIAIKLCTGCCSEKPHKDGKDMKNPY